MIVRAAGLVAVLLFGCASSVTVTRVRTLEGPQPRCDSLAFGSLEALAPAGDQSVTQSVGGEQYERQRAPIALPDEARGRAERALASSFEIALRPRRLVGAGASRKGASADVVLGIVVLDYQGCETGADRARGLVTVQAHTPDGQKLWELQAEHEVGPREGQPQACLPDLLGAVAPALAEAAARMLD